VAPATLATRAAVAPIMPLVSSGQYAPDQIEAIYTAHDEA